jgi:osmotically-inducible protein OsmY
MVQEAVLPMAEADVDLWEDVHEALLLAEPTTVSAIQVGVEDGVVVLEGVVRTEVARQLAPVVVSTVPGVKRVISRLTSDTEIQIRVASAIMADRRFQRSKPIQVESFLGNVRLRGRVPSAEHKILAEQIARQVPGVKDVINELTVGP